MARTRLREEDESPSFRSFRSCVSYLTASAGASVTLKKREDSREANHAPDPRAHTSRRREAARTETPHRDAHASLWGLSQTKGNDLPG